MSEIKRVLMKRDNISADEANSLINEAKRALQEYLEDGDLMAAENICAEYFGLEPDYVMELF